MLTNKEVFLKKLNTQLEQSKFKKRVAEWGMEEVLKILEPLKKYQADQRFIPKRGEYGYRYWEASTTINDHKISMMVSIGNYYEYPELSVSYNVANSGIRNQDIRAPWVRLEKNGKRLRWGEVSAKVGAQLERLKQEKLPEPEDLANYADLLASLKEAYERREEARNRLHNDFTAMFRLDNIHFWAED